MPSSWASSHGLSRCYRCGRIARLTITQRGKRLLVDPDPREDGNVAAFLDGTGTWRSRVLGGDRGLQFHEKVFYPHLTSTTCKPADPPAQPARRAPGAGQGALAAGLPAGVASLDAARARRAREARAPRRGP